MSPSRSPPPAARAGTSLAQGRRSRSAPPALLSPAPPRALPRKRAHYPVHLSYDTMAVLQQQQNSEPAGLAFTSTMFRWDETPLASAELQSRLLEVRRSTAGIEASHAARRRFHTTFGLVRFPEPWGNVVDLD